MNANDKAKSAARILQEPAFQQACEDVAKAYFDAARALPLQPKYDQARKAYMMAANSLDSIKDHLRVAIEQGKAPDDVKSVEPRKPRIF